MKRTVLSVALTVVLVGAVAISGSAGAAVTFTTVPLVTGTERDTYDARTDGAWVVWTEGVTSDPDADTDIWVRNLRTGIAGPLESAFPAIQALDQRKADVSMDRVVYEHWVSETDCNIRGTDLRTGASAGLAVTAARETWPRISGDLVVWLNEALGQLQYGNLRTVSVDGTLGNPGDWFVSWDVDRGRIAYMVSSDLGAHLGVWTFRPGVDSEPVLVYESDTGEEGRGVALHGDTISIATETQLVVRNVVAGTGVTIAHGADFVAPFHTSLAWAAGSETISGVRWEEVPSVTGDSVVDIAGGLPGPVHAFRPSLFGRRIVYTRYVEPAWFDYDIYVAYAAPESHRTFGPDRYATAAAASAAYYGAARNAVLCTGENFPDALAAAPFAKTVDAPLLLTRASALPAATIAELLRLDVEHAFLIGGPTVIGPAVETVLSGLGISFERIAGATRYETANLLAARIVDAANAHGGYSGYAFFARGDDYPDALAVGPVACQADAPIFLVKPGELPASVSDAIAYLYPKYGAVVGGTGAVSEDVKTAIDTLLTANGGAATLRWYGDNRYATAVAVTNGGLQQRFIDLDTLGVATGENFPDALGGGAALGYYGSGLVLTRQASVPPEVMSFLTSRQYEIGRLDVFGGAATVSDSVKATVTAQLR